jgi:hypothetical protein
MSMIEQQKRQLKLSEVYRNLLKGLGRETVFEMFSSRSN